MSHPKHLVIWSNARFPDEVIERLRAGIGAHRWIQSPTASAVNLTAGTADALLEQADIAFGQPQPQQVMTIPRLKWVQLHTAGYTLYDTPEFREAMKRNGTIVCNASSIYAEPCAQHVMAMMLALSRRLPQAMENQRGPREWPYIPMRQESRLLNGQTVLLVGYGAIARRLAELLQPLPMNVIVFRRNPKSCNERGVQQIHSVEELDAFLPQADHVINILPASRETNYFFNADRFAKMKRNARYYNIGRGSTNDEYALWTCLETGHVASAYIDAFTAEPLPKNHPLWTTPNCFITPHTAGGHHNEYDRHVDLFLENLRRLETGQDLLDRIM